MTAKFGLLAPYLLGLFFVLSLVANSNGEMVHARDLLLPIGGVVAVAGAAHLGAWRWTRDAAKATLIAWVVVLAFASFGIALEGTGQAGTIGPSPAELTLLLLFGVAGGAFAIVIAKAIQPLGGVLDYVTLVSAVLATWNGLQSIPTQVVAGQPVRALAPSGIAAPAMTGRQPDVLLLILDKYTSSRTLAKQYGFDNRAFETFLRKRGFLVPAGPRTNYVQTFLSLAAFLNLTYLDSVIADIGPETRDRTRHYAAIEDNRLAAFFRERGYEFVFFPTAYGATRQNRFADRQLPNPTAIRPEFVTAWYQTTPLPTLHRLFCAAAGCMLPMPYVPETATMLDWKFEQLARLPGQPRPIFVLAHLTVPHEPYIYRADCRHRAPYWPNRDDGAEADAVRSAYVDQVRCLNRKLETLIASWQTRTVVPPVILLQSDHGHGLGGRHLPEVSGLRPEQVADRVSVFAAYLVPGAEPRALPDTVTPINAMRFMLRGVFGADLPALEDATYWSSFARPNHMTRIR